MKTVQKNQGQPRLRAFDPLPEMDEDQFRQWVSWLEKRTGTVVPPERKSFLVTNLGIRMREIGCNSYQEYFEQLNSGVSGLREWSTLVDRITVHETRFFRHPASLEEVKSYVANKPVTGNGKLSIHAWSVACSTGEEAYTLAMVIDQALRQRGIDGVYGVTATDISPASLATGREAEYPARRVDQLEPSLAAYYFTPSSKRKNYFHVTDTLRKRVCFACMNILDADNEPLGKMDIIYCQNLLIYFDRQMREQIVNSLVQHLMPGGIMILGSGELLGWEHPQMEKINNKHTLMYRRVDERG